MCLLILYLVNGNIGGKVSSLGIFIELEILLKFIYSEKATKRGTGFSDMDAGHLTLFWVFRFFPLVPPMKQ